MITFIIWPPAMDTTYLINVKKSFNPVRAFWFKSFEWDEERQVYVIWKLVGYGRDIDMDFVEYTKDQYAELCWFTSWATLTEARSRYKAEKEEARLAKYEEYATE